MYIPEDYTIEKVGETYARMVDCDGEHRIDIPLQTAAPDLEGWTTRVMALLCTAYHKGVAHGRRQRSREIRRLIEDEQ